LGARYLIKKSIIDFLGLKEGYHDIEIKNDPKGKPEVKVYGNMKKILLERNIQKIHVSISHSKQYISVLVILER
jgi:holo-[acyl-carrier protein] synthase